MAEKRGKAEMSSQLLMHGSTLPRSPEDSTLYLSRHPLKLQTNTCGGGGGGVERKEEVGKELSVDTGEVVSLGSKIKGIYRF